MKLFLATNNKHKIHEIKDMLPTWEIVTPKDYNDTDDPEETGVTFEENAYIKAKYFFDKYHLPTIADDSGIVVDALNGMPGVYSARYANLGIVEGNSSDEANRVKLFKELEKANELNNDKNRSAHFACAIAFIDENGNHYTFVGKTFGEITYEEIGENGFGYDCMFLSHDLNKPFGIASEEEKASVSHRGRAIREFKKLIDEKYN